MDRIQPPQSIPLDHVPPSPQNVSPTQVRHLQTLASKESGCWAFLKKVFYCIFCCFEPRNRPIDANHPLSERVTSCPAITRTVPQPEQPIPAVTPTSHQEVLRRPPPEQPAPAAAPAPRQGAPRRPMLERPVPAIALMPHQGAPERRAPEQPAPAAAPMPRQEAPQRRVILPAITNLPRNNELWSMAQYLSKKMHLIANWERIRMTPEFRNILNASKSIALIRFQQLNNRGIQYNIPHSFRNADGSISDKGYFCLSHYFNRPAFLPSYSLQELEERVNAHIPIIAIEELDDAESRILGLPLNAPPIQPEQTYTLNQATAQLDIKTYALNHYRGHPEEVAQIPQDTPRSPEGRITDMGYFYLHVNLSRRFENLPPLSHEEVTARRVAYRRNEIDDIAITAEERAEINRRREAVVIARNQRLNP